jgi:hypothetical protein
VSAVDTNNNNNINNNNNTDTPHSVISNNNKNNDGDDDANLYDVSFTANSPLNKNNNSQIIITPLIHTQSSNNNSSYSILSNHSQENNDEKMTSYVKNDPEAVITAVQTVKSKFIKTKSSIKKMFDGISNDIDSGGDIVINNSENVSEMNTTENTPIHMKNNNAAAFFEETNNNNHPSSTEEVSPHALLSRKSTTESTTSHNNNNNDITVHSTDTIEGYLMSDAVRRQSVIYANRYYIHTIYYIL